MYRQQISQKAAPSPRVAPINPAAQSPSYGSLSGVVQRVQQDPDSMSRDERQQLESAIGTRATKEILADQQAPWVPEFRGISAQLWGNSGQAPIQAKGKDDVGISEAQSENKTGLPDHLKAGIENLSGMAMDDVRVHYNSSKPSTLQALAYTQGTDIHVAPGQEKHIPHEAWHVVQQKQGRVQPTMQMMGKVRVNDNAGLEKEADIMGQEALKSQQNSFDIGIKQRQDLITHKLPQLNGLVQRVMRHGVDPLVSYALGGDPSLLYGLHSSRQVTQQRLTPQDAGMGAVQPIRTIDDYNASIGINALMTANMSAVGLFIVREALSDHNPIANWGNYFPAAAVAVAADANLQAWIGILVANRQSVGLYDFGDRTKVSIFGFRRRAGVSKINSKNRLRKNLGNPNAGHANNIRPQDINSFLRPNRTFNQALAAFQVMTAPQQAALNQFIYKAFFRRTSKLGIDFAIHHLHGRINFNTAAAIDHNSLDPQTARVRIKGLEQANLLMDQTENRAITISELRHIKKGLLNNTILPTDVNFYDEY